MTHEVMECAWIGSGGAGGGGAEGHTPQRPAYVARLLLERGTAHLNRGAFAIADGAFEHARRCGAAGGDQAAVMDAMRHLVATAAGRGAWALADARSAELVEVTARRGSRHDLGVALRVRAEVFADASAVCDCPTTDAVGLAFGAFEATLMALEEQADVVEFGLALRGCARVWIARGETARALTLVERAKRLLAH